MESITSGWTCEPQIWWTDHPPDLAALRRAGYRVVGADAFVAAVAAARSAGTSRRTLANPAARWLGLLDRTPRLAVVGLSCTGLADLRAIHDYLIEPAARRGCRLVLAVDRPLAALDPADLVDPGWGYPWTLERVQHLLVRAAAGPGLRRSAAAVAAAAPGPVAGWRRWTSRLPWPGDRSRSGQAAGPDPPHLARLDPGQRAAATAGDGVVQVIAPAGSGKTTVLVARVAELVARGTAPGRILCTAFNRDAGTEMAARLAAAGLGDVAVRTFHGLGREILAVEGRLRPALGEVETAVWAALAAASRDATAGGILLDPDAAREAVSAYKLAAMIAPAEAQARAAGTADAHVRTAACLYALYEAHLARAGQHDLDDLISVTVRLLRRDPRVRRRWQARCERVLVDEYQDIEPAQALLVGILAAPGDSLFCVGDEDQCIYAWRRASVQRVVALDQVYPGLERHALPRNYRCGRRITRASRRLIGHNRQRFRKPLRPGARHAGQIAVHAALDLFAGAELVAGMLCAQLAGRDGAPGSGPAAAAAGAVPPPVAVLARTSALLRDVGLACARRGVRFVADARILWPAAADGLAQEPDALGRALAGLQAEDNALLAAHREDPPDAAGDGRGPGAPRPAIELATVHGAKGREWDHVILHGADRGVFPHDGPGDGPDELEAERRLFYVAMTRARRRLDIVCSRGQASRFVAEAGLRVGP